MRAHHLLAQQTWWIDHAAQPHKIADMTPDYRSHLLEWLRKRAAFLRASYEWSLLDELEQGSVQFDFDEIDIVPHRHREALAWLERQPLVVRLAQLVALDRHNILEIPA